jgi:hypothetical protein
VIGIPGGSDDEADRSPYSALLDKPVQTKAEDLPVSEAAKSKRVVI